jgi:acetyl esterase/lipase
VEDLDLKLSVSTPCKCMKVSARVYPFASVFGTDPEVLKQASPITHVRPGLPPFLLLSAGFDYCPLRQMTKDFAAALEENNCDVEVQVVPWRTHETLVFDILHQTAEPKMIEAVVNFIDRCRAGPRR